MSKFPVFFLLGLLYTPKVWKICLNVFLKYSPQKSDDFRFLQIEKISFQSKDMGIWKLQEISICFHLFCTYSSNFHHYVYSSYTDHIFFWFIKSLNCPQAPQLCLWDKKYKIIVTKFKKIGSDIPLKLQNKSFWMLIFFIFLIFHVSNNLFWCIYLLLNDHINIVLKPWGHFIP